MAPMRITLPGSSTVSPPSPLAISCGDLACRGAPAARRACPEHRRSCWQAAGMRIAGRASPWSGHAHQQWYEHLGLVRRPWRPTRANGPVSVGSSKAGRLVPPQPRRRGGPARLG